MKDRIDRAVDTIRGYCAKVKYCGDCRFMSKDKNCLFMNDTPPCDWRIDKTGNRQKREAGT